MLAVRRFGAALGTIGLAAVLTSCAGDDPDRQSVQGAFPATQNPYADPLCTDPTSPSCPSLDLRRGVLPSVQPPERQPSIAATAPPVALLVPLSGQYAEFGQAMVDAAQLAVYNLADDNFELIVKDTRGTPRGAALAVQEALAEGAQLVLGPLLSTSVRQAAPYVLQRRINMIAFTTDRRVAGNGVFVMGFLPRTEIERVVAYATSQGIRRFAALAPKNDYGRVSVQEMRRAVALYNGVVTVETFYDPGAGDYSAIVRNFARFESRAAAAEQRRQQLQGRDDVASLLELQQLSQREANVADVAFDALLLPDTGQRLLSIAPLLPFYDIDPGAVRFLGTGLWDEPTVQREPALTGGWFAAPPPALRHKFEDQFVENFRGQPKRLATLAYDATALAAVLARGRTSASTFPFTMQAITSPNGFAGIDGIFRFLPDGLIDRGLAVLQVTGQQPNVVSDGPTTFQIIESGGNDLTN